MHLDPDDAARALRELRRVTRAGGVALVNVKAQQEGCPATGFEGDADEARWFHYWTTPDFVAVAESSGWAVRSAAVVADRRAHGAGRRPTRTCVR